MTKQIDSREVDVSKPKSFDMPASGAVDSAQFKDEYQPVDIPNWKDKAAALAFNEELILVELMNDNDPQAEQVVQTGVNGVNQFLLRGKAQWIKRKFLAALATSQPESISTPEYTNARGDRGTRIIKNRTQKYPFRVLEDRNPDGRVWLERLMKS